MVDGLFAAAFFYAADLPGPFPGKWWILYKEVGWIFLALALAGLVWCMRAACKFNVAKIGTCPVCGRKRTASIKLGKESRWRCQHCGFPHGGNPGGRSEGENGAGIWTENGKKS